MQLSRVPEVSASSNSVGAQNRKRAVRRLLLGGLLTLFLLAAAGVYWPARVITQPIRLPDQSRAWVRSGSSVLVAPDFKNTRAVDFSGEMLIRVLAAEQPLRIHVPLLFLTVPKAATFIVTAQENGVSQVEVLEGTVDIARDFHSSWRQEIHVIAGQTAMLIRKVSFLEADSTRQRDIPSWTHDYWPPSANP